MVDDFHQGPPRRDFDSFFFGSAFGFLCYYLLRNDWVWSRLNEDEKEFVKAQNAYWNNNAQGYKNPQEYQGQEGRDFRCESPRTETWEGRQIQLFLEREQPRRVLEIGPGSGYYTRQIIDHSSVKEYVATDINQGFLKYIDRAISEHPRTDVRTSYVTLDALEAIEKVDAIVILSALHHIPDRADVVRAMGRLLRENGSIFFFEPSHSLARVAQFLLSALRKGWLFSSVVNRRNNYMTHHFCTVSETRAIARHAGLELARWDVRSRIPLPSRALRTVLAKEMVAVLRRPCR